jgi:predicted TIM-barrel fold metal-dependent hydrolase
VIDVHAHIGRTIATGKAHTYAEYIETMRASGIRCAILSPMAGGRQADGVRDTMRENDAIAEAVNAHPDRFPIGLATVEVRHEEKALEELKRAFGELGLRGLSFHAMFSGFFVGRGRVLDPLLDYANQRGALCLMHAMPEAGEHAMEPPEAIGELATRFPEVVFIMGHPAITNDQRARSIEAARGRDNVYVDLALETSPETTEVFVAALGAERVLFGSDAPFRDPRVTIRAIEAAQIGDNAKERILHRNAAELIDRFAPGAPSSAGDAAL